MNDEVDSGPEATSKGVVWIWLCWLGAAVMLYVLSSGPFWLLVDKKIIRYHTPAWRVGQIVYWPLGCACEATFVRKPLTAAR
jgi:hypothetical protein